MSIYIPAKHQKTGGAKALADFLIDLVESLVTGAPEKFAMAHSTGQLEKNFAEGKISLPLGIENGAAIEGKLENVKHFYDRGVRYITLTHSKDNAICDSSYDDRHTHGGLTKFGREVVGETQPQPLYAFDAERLLHEIPQRRPERPVCRRLADELYNAAARAVNAHHRLHHEAVPNKVPHVGEHVGERVRRPEHADDRGSPGVALVVHVVYHDEQAEDEHSESAQHPPKPRRVPPDASADGCHLLEELDREHDHANDHANRGRGCAFIRRCG